MSEFLGREYNYSEWKREAGAFELFRTIAYAGDEPPDFTLPAIDGDEVKLSALRGKPVVLEFGSIT